MASVTAVTWRELGLLHGWRVTPVLFTQAALSSNLADV